MKEEIMSKLFNNEELTSEEMIYIGRNLQNGEQNILPFDHSKDTLEACSLSAEDFDTINQVLKTQIEDNKPSMTKASEFVEKFERVALSNPKFLRIILMNHIRLLFQSQNPLLSLLIGLRGH